VEHITKSPPGPVSRASGMEPSLGHLLRRANRLVQTTLEARFEAADISFTQWVTLDLIGRAGSIATADLAAAMNVTSSALIRLTGGLEARRLLTRHREGNDQRAVRLTLTPAGQAKLDETRPVAVERWRTSLDGVSASDAAHLVALLHKLNTTIERNALDGRLAAGGRFMKKTALAMLVASLLSGCASLSHVKPQVAQIEAPALGLGTQSPMVGSDWWTAYHDPQLDRLVQMGLADNPSLATALARVRQAAATVDIEQSGLLPHVDGAAQFDRYRIGDRFLPSPIGGHTENLGIAATDFSWDLDLFGRQHAAIRQAAASSRAAMLDVGAARLTLAVSIARTYIGLARAEQLIRVAEGYVQTRRRALGYAQSRLRNHLSSQFDIEQARTLSAQAEQARTQAVQQRDALVHGLAALAGQGAGFYARITPPTLHLDQAPKVPDGLAADLLGRRPDLLADQARIDEAIQGRQVARDAFYPNVTIAGLAGLTAAGVSKFFTGGAFSFSVGPAISLPIFEGGKLRAQYRGATADLDGVVAHYNNAVLSAVREAADAMTNVRSADCDLAEQGQVVRGLRETVRLDGVRTRTGLGSQLDAVDSGFRLLQAEEQLVDLQADTFDRRVQLVAALGGGFETSRAPASARP
jgi:NodT family efflux transporter outer membrane factor (OMF) lipoprotein